MRHLKSMNIFLEEANYIQLPKPYNIDLTIIEVVSF